MSNGENSIPFGAPPVGFMQTGNQQVNLEPPQMVNPEDNPFVESVKTSSQEVPAFESSQPADIPFDSSPPANFSQPPTFNNQPQQTSQQTKYQIFDMFWLINPKYYANPMQQPIVSEAHFVVISFNISFGNLRVSYFNMTNNSVQGNVIYLENLKRTVTGTIYPSTAFNTFSSPRLTTTCMEQLFRQIPGANWQQERPVCTIQKIEDKLRFTIADPKNGKYFYDFIGWQYLAFMKALEFSFTKGFELSAQQHMK